MPLCWRSAVTAQITIIPLQSFFGTKSFPDHRKDCFRLFCAHFLLSALQTQQHFKSLFIQTFTSFHQITGHMLRCLSEHLLAQAVLQFGTSPATIYLRNPLLPKGCDEFLFF
jgi:hypothetical protein